MGMPRISLNVILIAAIFALVLSLPFVMIARARVAKSDQTRIHLILDMDNQPRYKAQQPNPMFADGRAMRPPVAGTVARDEPVQMDALHTGLENGEFISGFPGGVEVTEAFVRRGRDQFEIFCAACHGLAGTGNGMVAQRAEQLQEGTWTPPLSFHENTVIGRPNGHLYNTVANGIRNMPAYGDQIGVEDRWAVVAYVRALQRSQKASLDDVPAEQRGELERLRQQQ